MGELTGRALASEPRPQRGPASVAGSSDVAAIDQAFQRATDLCTVSGVVALGATRKELIGDINVTGMKTAEPAYSNSFDQFPGTVHKWGGVSFDINTRPGPRGRSAGSVSWAGLLNCYLWLDPVKQVTGAFFARVLPFYDQGVVDLFGRFEEGPYGGLARA
jgi:hypothetical protein